jgi:hypothetical protein
MSNGGEWLDLETMLVEELRSIRPVPNDAGARSAVEPQPRAGADPTPDGEIYRSLHAADLWALCLSGGGIRSATFALGLVQGLARAGLLERFHYLSTVSGGGYIGSWLSSWASRHDDGFAGVAEDLKSTAIDGGEPKPVRHLRSFTAYLTPRTGILSADTWTLIATYLRNLLLNWLIIMPLLAALLLTPKIGLALVRLRSDAGITGWIHGHQGAAAGAVALVGMLCLLTGMYFVFNRLTWPAAGATHGPATQRDFLLRCLLPLMLAALLLPLAWAWRSLPLTDWKGLSTLVGIGVLLRGAAWSLPLISIFGQAAAATDQDRKRYRRLLPAVVATGAVGGMLSWWAATTFFGDIQDNIADVYQAGSSLKLLLYTCFAPPVLLLTLLVTEALFIGLVSRATDDDDREWWGRSGAWLLIAGLFWMAIRLLVLFGPLVLYWLETNAPVIVTALGGISGIATAVLGKSEETSGTPGKPASRGVSGFLRGIALTLFATVFICMLFAGLSLATDWILIRFDFAGTIPEIACAAATRAAAGSGVRPESLFHPWWEQCGLPAAMQVEALGLLPIILAIVVLIAAGLLVQPFVNVNRFSLHAMYRARLIRAYLGASNATRRPEPFTGFDPTDNIRLSQLWPNSPGSKDPPPQPFHIVNVALNLVSATAERLAWQQRKAESMTISPLHCGSWELGYRRSAEYACGAVEGWRDLPYVRRVVALLRPRSDPNAPRANSGEAGSAAADQPTGITLGTAMTISGAAASPNMGYHSSPIVALIMTLFNLRLGAWFGNPGRVGEQTYESDGPFFAAKYLAYEALGLTNENAEFVYLSDGGHFENLGLYEMIRRRCRLIVVSDAGCDPEFEFEDLGNAIRKIRIDLGVDIVMTGMEMHPRPDAQSGPASPTAGRYFAIGRIHYPEKVEGRLIYIKPGLYGGEPEDVVSYAATHPAFPHEPTSDQWFDESQFESYRRLGLHVAQTVFGAEPGTFDIDKLEHVAQEASTTTISPTHARLVRRRRRGGWAGRAR